MMQPQLSSPHGATAEWSQRVLGAQVDAASEALRAFRRKPKSPKRLHRARKRLARLRGAIEDLGPLARVGSDFAQRVRRLHKRAGKVRDADVWLERLRGYGDVAQGTEREQILALCEGLRKRRKRMRRKLMRELNQ